MIGGMTTTTASQTRREVLPWSALLALGTAVFITSLTETLPAGVLPQMTSSLGVSSGAAGQAVTVYAAGTALTAIPLAAATAGIRRKPLLLSATTVFLIANTLTAAAPGYAVLLIARFLMRRRRRTRVGDPRRLRAPHRASRPGGPCHRNRDDRDPPGAVAGCSRRDADRATDRVASVLRRRLSNHPRRHRVDHVQRSRHQCGRRQQLKSRNRPPDRRSGPLGSPPSWSSS